MNLSTEELQTLVAARAVSLIDVRSGSEFAIEHIPGAINIPLEQIESRLGDIPEGQLALICEGGQRAQVVACRLRGRENLNVLDGGMRSWRKAGLPTVACRVFRWSLERQVRFGAGMIVLVGSLLAAFSSQRWIYLPMFVGAGLTFAGLTNICGMAVVLAKMPWNSRNGTTVALSTPKDANCCT